MAGIERLESSVMPAVFFFVQPRPKYSFSYKEEVSKITKKTRGLPNNKRKRAEKKINGNKVIVLGI